MLPGSSLEKRAAACSAESNLKLEELIYQNLDDLLWCVQQGNANITEFDCSCFNGKYVTGDIDNHLITIYISQRYYLLNGWCESDADFTTALNI
jgi:glutamine phosphoribosylpyrophosphate amidotransferase